MDNASYFRSHMVELDGGRYHLHANSLRKFNVRAEAVECNSLACDIYSIDDECTVVNNCNVIYDTDLDFGDIVVVNPTNLNTPLRLPSQ